MSGVNKVILVGNLGRDPELRSTQNGERIATLNLATSESWTKNGPRQERTEWHRIVIFNERLAEVAEKYLRKGSKIYVEGQLQTRKWTDQQGQERYSTEIVLTRFRGELVLLDSREREEPQRQERQQVERARDNGWRSGSLGDDLNDSIPFLTAEPSSEPYLKRRVVL